jgi:lysophospholipase L1-like esterase
MANELIVALFLFSMLLAAAVLVPLPLAHATPISVGVMGDSLSDEYAFNGRGYAANWVEQLATAGLVNFGSSGSFTSPRNSGYAQNWALSGATSGSLLSGGQASGLAAQIPIAGIQYAVLAIGANDFNPSNSAYQDIYAGTWSTSTINAYVAQSISNIKTALDTVLPTGVKVAVATIPDYGSAPAVVSAFPVAAQRQAVTDVIHQVNLGIIGLAQTDHLVVADLAAMGAATFGTNASPNANLLIGNVPIHLNQTTSSNPSQAAFVSDGVHPNTTIQGVMADLFMQALDTGYQAGVPLFTEQQILAHDGLAYVGSDTLPAYTNFVINFVPEPSAWLLAATGATGLGLSCWRRRHSVSRSAA